MIDSPRSKASESPAKTQLVPRVAFVVGQILRESSGVARSCGRLSGALVDQGLPVTIFTAASQGPVARNMLPAQVGCVAARGRWLGGLSHSPQLRVLLERAMPEIDVVHQHSLWMLPNHYASAAAFRFDKPVVYSPRGSLEPWCLRRSWWKKRIADAWFQSRDLRRAACLHALTEQEAAHIRQLGLRNPIAVVPNGVRCNDFDALPDPAPFRQQWPSVADKRICLFLSRVHRKKGLSHLVVAWSRVVKQYPDWHLVIAGPDDGAEWETRRAATELGIDGDVTFVGPCYGEQKRRALAASEMFVLPSFSEGFSNAILEAMAAGLPVLISPECHFPEVELTAAGVEAEPTVDATERALRDLLEMRPSERREMGRHGRRLVETEYDWESVAQRMAELYRWLVGGGAPPTFVETE